MKKPFLHVTMFLILQAMFATLALGQDVELLKSPTGVAVDSRGNIYIAEPNEVQVYSPRRKLIKKIAMATVMRGNVTSKVALDTEDHVFATNGKDILARDGGGKLMKSIVSDPDSGFRGFAIDSRGRFVVANSVKEVVEVFSSDGKAAGSFGKKAITVTEKVNVDGKDVDKEVEREVGEPRDVFLRDGKVYVAHRDGVSIWNYDAETGKAVFEDFVWNKWECSSCCVDSKGRLYAAQTSNSFWCYEINVNIFEKGEDGKWKRTGGFNGDPYKFFDNPQDLAVEADDEIVIADTGNRRVLIQDPEHFASPINDYTTWEETFAAETPKIYDITETSAKISWTTNENVMSVVLANPVVERGISPTLFASGGTGTEHVAELKKLKPGTRYKVYMSPYGKNIPAATGSRYYAFCTKPPEEKMEYIKLPVLAVIFKNIVILPKNAVTKEMPTLPQTPDEEMERIYAQLDQAELFYWVNSGLRFCLDIKPLVIEDFYYDAPLGNYFYPNEEGHKKIREMLRERKIDAKQYGGVVVLNCIRHYNPETKEFTYDRGTGGGTIGTYPPIEGFCSWRGFSNNSWLFTHEFGHSIDIKFQRSGMPEYPINHFMIDGDYGTHYDGIAFQSRTWGDRWFRMNFGELIVADDKDGDGVPDDDPDVPLDEKRFGSSAEKKDTDGDGLSDYDEIMASKWVWDGENDRVADGYVKPDPNNKDTDGDGIEDGKDTYPLYPYRTEIPMMQGDMDLAEDDVKCLETKDGDFKARLDLWWSNEELNYTFIMNKPSRVMLQIDPKNDGFVGEWGKDNYWINVDSEAKEIKGKVPGGAVADLGIKLSQYEPKEGEDGERIVMLEIPVPKNEEAGLTLKGGETIGFLVYFRPDGYEGKDITPFSPNEFFDVTLVKEKDE